MLVVSPGKFDLAINESTHSDYGFWRSAPHDEPLMSMTNDADDDDTGNGW